MCLYLLVLVVVRALYVRVRVVSEFWAYPASPTCRSTGYEWFQDRLVLVLPHMLDLVDVGEDAL